MRFLPIFFRKKKNDVKQTRHLLFAKFFERRIASQKGIQKVLLILLQIFTPVILSLGALSLKQFADPTIGIISPFIIVFLPILVSGLIGGFWSSLFSTVISAIGILYLYIPPYNSFVLNNTKFLNTTLLLFEGTITAVILEIGHRSMMQFRQRMDQQATITQIGYLALTTKDMQSLFAKTAQLMTRALNVKYCKILELQPGKRSFILRGGVGWRSGLVGHSIITAGKYSQGGYALDANKPVVVKNLRKEERFYSPELLMSHGIISGVSVVIPGKRGPYGILGIHSDKKRKFTADDIYFIQASANILATTIEEKTADQQLRESQIRFKRLFDSNIVGAFISDVDGKLLEANDTLLTLIGYSRKELHEGKIQRDKLVTPEQVSLNEKTIQDLKTKGKSPVHEKIYITKTGKKVPVLVAMSRIDPRKDLYVGFVLDISKQKELEKRKDEFMSIASHELKTPVTTLKVLSQFLKKKFTNGTENDAVKYLNKMDKQINKLTELIGDLLDITKIQAGRLELHKEVFNLNDLVREVTEDITTIDSSHKIIVRGKLHDAVLADRERIGQVIINLLTNAIKYSSKGKDIVITAENKDKRAVISVKDRGVGIERMYQKNIFDQFFRVNNSTTQTYPGLGMGLFISREIIKRHDGDIWVESTKNEGSLFSFALPLTTNTYEKAN